jgi:hypothetical protein
MFKNFSDTGVDDFPETHQRSFFRLDFSLENLRVIVAGQWAAVYNAFHLEEG